MTKICRFNEGRLGLVEGEEVVDVTGALSVLPARSWPEAPADALIANLPAVLEAARGHAATGRRHRLSEVTFLSPVATPPKIIAAPVNYRAHQDEANADGGKNFAPVVKSIAEYGLFLKSSTSLVGFGEGIEIAYPDRRTDHEIELIAVIGKPCRNVSRADALDHIAGYCMGLDMTLRGTEDRSLRKSLDTFSVVGPWLVTADEIADPNNLAMRLDVNGQPRQRASTSALIFDVQRLVEYASAHFSLFPGDIIFTGTPEGVGPVDPGDRIRCAIDGLGEAVAEVRKAEVIHR